MHLCTMLPTNNLCLCISILTEQFVPEQYEWNYEDESLYEETETSIKFQSCRVQVKAEECCREKRRQIFHGCQEGEDFSCD